MLCDGRVRAVVYITLGVLGVCAGYLLKSPGPVESIRSSADTSDSIVSRPAAVPAGVHLTAYVLISYRCGFSQQRIVKQSLAKLRAALRQRHGGTFARISVVGVAVDHQVASALEYFNEVGLEKFDEVAVGNGWLNTSIAGPMWQDSASEAMVPQVILVARRVRASFDPLSIVVGDAVLVDVIAGAPRIVEWIAQAAPLTVSTAPWIL